ncbi:uncharacterized protein LOC131250816 isoform X2 [Magnolia sinica]|uniref:uncharacterized protein LOC131250816 isoform X2 n=1 Tax=Magnolia sinica TaxID=86752 RepID=UPI00265AF09D|nr:uncharacterized protein LOC131250816 isoform X2 [Magnolia sinica]
MIFSDSSRASTMLIQSHPLPFFSNSNDTSRVQSLLQCSTSDACGYGKEKSLASAWKVYIRIPRKSNFNVRRVNVRNAPVIKAIATFEPKLLVQRGDGLGKDYDLQSGPDSIQRTLRSLRDDTNEMDEKERLRRVRISKANRGNVPWNKGKKHSAETLRRIRERTKLAMQDPKVKMKLVNLGHAQSEETRKKIGAGVRIGWERRRKWLMVQETCHFEWQNMIAEASRKGYTGEDELQWDSYRILDKQLKKEWLESIEKRKTAPRPKGSKRAPKSPEQRKKISEAISAKWADPGYRDRVYKALSEYHGTPVGVKRKTQRKPTGETPSLKQSSTSNRATVQRISASTEGRSLGKAVPRQKKDTIPSYEDPLADSKLEMIKKIREERAAMEMKKSEAMERAKLLIAEAEKAAKALEGSALKSPLARASLLETRKLIAEATRSIQSIETGQLASCNGRESAASDLGGSINQFHEDPDDTIGSTTSYKEVNGANILSSGNHDDFDIDKSALEKVLNGMGPTPATQSKERIPTGMFDDVLPSMPSDRPLKQPGPSDSRILPDKVNGASNGEKNRVTTPRKFSTSSSAVRTKKKWVCGRLVEVADD